MSGGRKLPLFFLLETKKRKDDSYDSSYEYVLVIFYEQIHRLKTDVVQNLVIEYFLWLFYMSNKVKKKSLNKDKFDSIRFRICLKRFDTLLLFVLLK
jgi:hypothetical protein